MSIFNNEEIDKLSNEVCALRQQVTSLQAALDKIGQRFPPNETPQQKDTVEARCISESGTNETGVPKLGASELEVPKPEDSKPVFETLSNEVTEKLQAVGDTLATLSEKIDTAVYQEKIIRDMHQELTQLKKGLVEDLKKDYLTDILNICERMGDTDRHIQPDKPDYDAAKAKQLVTNTYLYIRDHLSDQYSVEYFEPAAGDAYEPKAHRAIRVIETEEEDKAGTVAECIIGGFRNSETGRVLRQARIAVYKKSH